MRVQRKQATRPKESADVIKPRNREVGTMIDTETKEKMLKYADRLYELEQLDVVKEFTDVLHKVVGFQNEKPKKEYYKSSSKYDYFIVYPYEEFTLLNSGKYGFRQRGYDIFGERIDKKYERFFCLSLCNKSKEEIIETIERAIIEDDKDDK